MCYNYGDIYYKSKLDTWSLSLCRSIIKNNVGLRFYPIYVDMYYETFIPNILVFNRLFFSNSEVKRNRPDLFRNFIEGEKIKVGKLELILEGMYD